MLKLDTFPVSHSFLAHLSPTEETKVSLVCVVCLCKHVGLQSGEISRVMPALPDLHVQQVGVYGRVVRLQQPALDGLSCKNKKMQNSISTYCSKEPQGEKTQKKQKKKK